MLCEWAPIHGAVYQSFKQPFAAHCLTTREKPALLHRRISWLLNYKHSGYQHFPQGGRRGK